MITQAEAIELFDYNPKTGALVMRSGQVGWYENGYLRFTLPVSRIKVRGHQIAWLIVYGEWTKVDHANTDKADNRIVNLRKCTPSQNGANTGLKATNSTREHFGEFARTK